jgi:hypothetical protein
MLHSTSDVTVCSITCHESPKWWAAESILYLLSCSPFTSNDNTYHGAIRMTAGAVRTTDDAITSNALGADYAD